MKIEQTLSRCINIKSKRILSKNQYGLLLVFVVKQIKTAVAGSGGWPSAAFAISMKRFLSSFQEN
ncbi:hypothetical protein DI383_02330 [Flavobacteriaceae bacterium LYZ1037]|nr:hypothetical protein DI383_02325 [Flavobacteriaceae bacterium LYZ1037]PWI31525.1 hypothetical protein DI383_02330 [Flavobacteriaceae bacterium LYZ1037]